MLVDISNATMTFVQLGVDTDTATFALPDTISASVTSVRDTGLLKLDMSKETAKLLIEKLEAML